MTNRTEKRRAYMAAYYQKNKERMDADSAQWAKDNPEARRIYGQRYYAENPDKEKARHFVYRVLNQDERNRKQRERQRDDPEKHRNQCRRSREKHPERVLTEYAKRKAYGSLHVPRGTVRHLETIQLATCVFCPADILTKRDIDHILPLSRGGLHCAENLQILCPRCNRSKGAKTNEEFALWLEANR